MEVVVVGANDREEKDEGMETYRPLQIRMGKKLGRGEERRRVARPDTDEPKVQWWPSAPEVDWN
jgi:hypothetical protein